MGGPVFPGPPIFWRGLVNENQNDEPKNLTTNRVIRFFTKGSGPVEKIEHVIEDASFSCKCKGCGFAYVDSTIKGGALFEHWIACPACCWRLLTATGGKKKPIKVCPPDKEFRKFFREECPPVTQLIKQITQDFGPIIPLEETDLFSGSDGTKNES